MLDLFSQIQEALYFAENFEGIKQQKDQLVRNLTKRSSSKLHQFIRDKEFYYMKEFLKLLKALSKHHHQTISFVSHGLKRTSLLKGMHFRRKLKETIKLVDIIYPEYFRLYNGLRHQLSALRKNDIERFMQLYEEQKLELSRLEKFNSSLNIDKDVIEGISLFSQSVAFINSYFKKANNLFKTALFGRKQYASAFSLRLVSILVVVLFLNITILFAQDNIKEDYMQVIFNHVVETHEPVDVDRINPLNFYFIKSDNFFVEVSDWQRDKTLTFHRLDYVDIEVKPGMLDSLRKGEKSTFMIRYTSNGTVGIEITRIEPKSKEFKKLEFGDMLATGTVMITRDHGPAWQRVLSKAELYEITNAVYDAILK